MQDLTEPLFDETYTGPRWTYGLRYRPMQIGAQPAGWIIGSVDDRPLGCCKWGTVQYPRKLSDSELAAFEMEDMTGIVMVNRHMEKCLRYLEEHDAPVRYLEAVRRAFRWLKQDIEAAYMSLAAADCRAALDECGGNLNRVRQAGIDVMKGGEE